MRNAGLDEAQARIMIARRNINNLRYAVTPLQVIWQQSTAVHFFFLGYKLMHVNK